MLCDGKSRRRNDIHVIIVGNLKSATPGKIDDAVALERISLSVEVALS